MQLLLGRRGHHSIPENISKFPYSHPEAIFMLPTANPGGSGTITNHLQPSHIYCKTFVIKEEISLRISFGHPRRKFRVKIASSCSADLEDTA